MAILLIIAAVVFVAGCANKSSNQTNTKEQAVSSFPTENDVKWMQTTYNNSDMFLSFANEVNDILSGKQEMNAQRLLFCAGEVTSWARNAQKQSEDMEVSPELKEAKAEYAKATGEYATMGDYINDGVLAVQRGNQEDGLKFLNTGMEHYNKAVTHYNNYVNITRKYGFGDLYKSDSSTTV